MSNQVDFDALWNYADPAGTERAFRALLPQSDLARELQLLTQIARAQGLQGHFEAGHQTLDQVEHRLTDETPTARLRLLLERGRLFNSAGDPDRARPLFEQVWDFGQQIGELGYAVDAGHMLGILEAPQLDWSWKAVALADQSSDPRARRWLTSLYNNIGWTYHDRGDYERALSAFEQALAYSLKQGNPDRIRVARWSVGRALRSLKRLDEALTLQQGLAAQSESGDGYVEEELAECLLALGRADDAKPYFALAYVRLSSDPYLSQHEPARLERLRLLSL